MLGVTFGDGTTPESTKVLQVTKMYDGVGDSPDYIFNIASDLNAAMGFYYLHPGYYKTVDPNDPTAIVTTSADGLITDKLIPAPVGELPLTIPRCKARAPAPVGPGLTHSREASSKRATTDRIPICWLVSIRAGAVPARPPPQLWFHAVSPVATGAAQSLRRRLCRSTESACGHQGPMPQRQTATPPVTSRHWPVTISLGSRKRSL